MRKRLVVMSWWVGIASAMGQTADASVAVEEPHGRFAAAPILADGSVSLFLEKAAHGLTKPLKQPVPPSREIKRIIGRDAAKCIADPALPHSVDRAKSNDAACTVSTDGEIGSMPSAPETVRDRGLSSVDVLADTERNPAAGVRQSTHPLGMNRSVDRAVMAGDFGEAAPQFGNGAIPCAERHSDAEQIVTDSRFQPGCRRSLRFAGLILGAERLSEIPLLSEGRPSVDQMLAQTSESREVAVGAYRWSDGPDGVMAVQRGMPPQRKSPSRLRSPLSAPNHTLLRSRLLNRPERAGGAARFGSPNSLYRANPQR